MAQPGFFDTENRLKKLDEKDNLLKLNQLVDWDIFRSTIETARRKSERKSNAGRKPYDALVMFKCLVLQQLYNLSDEEFEFQLRDRLTFIRFVGLNPEDTTPDANTLWDFRELLTKQNQLSNLFNRFNQYLDNKGLRARKGQIVDASFVEAPRQRNTREQNQTIKDGLIPAEFRDNPHVASQKDTDARWTQKNDEDHFGYKNHISVDVEHKLIRNFACTNAAVHDSNQFEILLAPNSSRDVWADSAYRSEEKEAILDAMNYRSHVHEKGNRSAALTEKQNTATMRLQFMEADWTRLQPPDQTTPAHPKVASPSRHNKRHSCTRTQRLASFVPVWLNGGCNPGSGFTLRGQSRR